METVDAIQAHAKDLKIIQKVYVFSVILAFIFGIIVGSGWLK